MRIGVFLCSIAVTALSAGHAVAADWYTGRNNSSSGALGSFATSEPAGEENWIVSVDSSVTATSKGSLFGSVVGTFAATGTLKQSGTRVRIDALSGTYNYDTDTTPPQSIRSQQMAGAGMVGYEWVSRNSTAAVYIGATAQNVSLSAADPKNKVVGTGVGAKISAEFYSRLTPTPLASGYASFSTLHSSYYTRLKYGWAILDDTYVGPQGCSTLLTDGHCQY